MVKQRNSLCSAIRVFIGYFDCFVQCVDHRRPTQYCDDRFFLLECTRVWGAIPAKIIVSLLLGSVLTLLGILFYY